MKKKKKKKMKENGACSQGECPRGKFLRQCRNALLITASYQIFSVCLDPGSIKDPLVGQGPGQTLLGTASQHISSAFINPALAQVPDPGPGTCAGGPDSIDRSRRRRGYRGCEGCNGYTGPSQEEIEQRRLTATGQSLNSQGAAASRNGDWQKAIDLYRQALGYLPYDEVIKDNLNKAEGGLRNAKGLEAFNNQNWQLAADYFREALIYDPNNDAIKDNLRNAEFKRQSEQQARERERQDAIATQNMRRMLLESASEERPSKPPKSSKGLDFMAAPAPAKQEPGSTKGQAKAGKQLETAKFHSEEAAKEAQHIQEQHVFTKIPKKPTDADITPMEITKEEARKQFDIPGDFQGPFKLDFGRFSKEFQDYVKKDKVMNIYQNRQDELKIQIQQADKEVSQIHQKMKSASPGEKEELAKQEKKISKDLEQYKNESANIEVKKAERVKLLIDTRREGSSAGE